MEWKLNHQKTTEDLFSIFVRTKKELIEDRILSLFSVVEETYVFATSLYGICGKKIRSHVLRVDADKVGVEMQNRMHGNERAKNQHLL